jgi:hypothetical protein
MSVHRQAPSAGVIIPQDDGVGEAITSALVLYQGKRIDRCADQIVENATTSITPKKGKAKPVLSATITNPFTNQDEARTLGLRDVKSLKIKIDDACKKMAQGHRMITDGQRLQYEAYQVIATNSAYIQIAQRLRDDVSDEEVKNTTKKTLNAEDKAKAERKLAKKMAKAKKRQEEALKKLFQEPDSDSDSDSDNELSQRLSQRLSMNNEA